MNDLDWNHLRALYMTAETGSLSAAARRMGLTQPTLSRQIAALETCLGVTLFERIGKRLALTETGLGLVAHVRAMDEAAAQAHLSATGRSETAEGRVSISVTDAYATYVLPPIVATIRERAPQITLVIVATNQLSDLRRREADIAIRHVRPEEPELVGRLIGTSTAGFYASRAWAARHGHPKHLADIASDLIGFDEGDRFSAHMRNLGIPVEDSDIRLISESAVVVWELVRQGLGVCAMLREVARRTPDLVELFPNLAPIEVPLWLVTHREVRTSRRIRLVFDILAEELTRDIQP